LIQARKEPSLQEARTKGGLIIAILDPKQFGQFSTTEHDRLEATVKAAGIKAD
jgi:tripartite-type tricarboxylate transporter receptor subunit TctC